MAVLGWGGFFSIGKAVKLMKIPLKVQSFCLCLFVVSSRSNTLTIINGFKHTFRPVRLI